MGDRDNLPELPQGWVWISIEQITNVGTGATPLRSNSKYYESGTIPWVTSGSLNELFVTQADEMITELAVLETNAKVFPRHTLLVAMYGEGKTRGKVSELLIEAATNQACAALVLEGQALELKPYVKLFLQKNYDDIRYLSSGGVQQNLNLGIIKATKIPLAPLTEQHRIVAKIDELFSELDAGVELLKKLKAKLKRYRQSVLKAAVEGKLTKDWHEAHQGELEPASVLLERILKERREKWEAQQLAQMKAKGKTPKDDKWKLKYKEPVAPDTSNLPELPEGWIWANTQQLGEVQLGRQRSPKNRSKDYPTKYIRAANITEKGLNLSDVLDMEFEPHEWERYWLRDGDILLSEASGSPDQVGKPAIWREQIPNCCFQNTVIRLRALNLSSEYLLIVFKSFYFNSLFARVAAGVGINHLSANKFCAIAVPLAPVLEQDYIITTVDYHISIAEKLEAIIEVNLKRAEKLRQSILKKAFEGKLVPQDPSNEPADKLLERIKAEKAKREAETKAKKKQKQPKKSQQLELF